MTSKSQEKQSKAAVIDEQMSRLYDFKKRLGKGAYGIVWKALDKRNNQTVAVKKIFDAFRDETDAQRTFREIVFLKAFRNHANVVSLLNVHKANNNLDVYLVFEYMESDLHNIIKKGTILKDVHKRYVMYQLINAIRFIHSGNVIHRDLKPCNILIDNKCRCKLADFGLARSVATQIPNGPDLPSTSQNPEVLLTDYVATRWYRAPEILVASKKYTKGIDMWSLGCILGEMLKGKPLFQGSSTVNQIEKIVATLPNITEEDVASIGEGFGTALLNQQSQVEKGPTLDELLRDSPPEAMNLVKSLLLLNPSARLTANDAINHAYVHKFRNTSDEIELKIDILPPFNDDIRLTIQEYRDKVYEMSQVSPHRVVPARPSSKQSSSSGSKSREPSRKSSDATVQAQGVATKKPSPPKKAAATTSMAHEVRSYSTFPKAGPHSTTYIKPKVGPAVPSVSNSSMSMFKLEKNKSGSSSGISDTSPNVTDKVEKPTRNLSIVPGRTNIQKKPSPVKVGTVAAAGGSNYILNKVGSTSKIVKKSPDNLKRTGTYDIPKKIPNGPAKLPSSNNIYCDDGKMQNIQSTVEATIFGSTVHNPNNEFKGKVPLPVGSTTCNQNQTRNGSSTNEHLKKPYDNSAYHLTGSLVGSKNYMKIDPAMLSRKIQQALMPGHLPQQQQQPPTQVPRKTNAPESNAMHYQNNKHNHNIEVQRSVPSMSNSGKLSPQLRNTKSEQSNTQLTINKKPDSLCYERRLRRLEEEIERYKKDVNFFCKTTYATTIPNGVAEKSKAPIKSTSPPNIPSRPTATMSMAKKYEISNMKTKLPSVGTTIPNDTASHQTKNERFHQYQNDNLSKQRETTGNISNQNSSSKFFTGGGGGGGRTTNNIDFSNHRLNKYINSQVKSAIKSVTNSNYESQYQLELNAGLHHHQQNHHHLAKYPYHFHQESNNMRPVAVSKLI